jgi:predicted flavoprotein YhiN
MARRRRSCGRGWRRSRRPTSWPGPKGLGQATFVGTSGRVFPKALKASPLLRAWIARLEGQGVKLNLRWTWTGWSAAGDLTFETPDGTRAVRPRATILALGGASWAKLGSDGAWAPTAGGARGDRRAVQLPANVGFTVAWTEVFRERFAGAPLKNIALSFEGVRCRAATPWRRATAWRAGRSMRCRRPCATRFWREGSATLEVDLRPDIALGSADRTAVQAARRAVAVELAAQGRPSVAGRDRSAARGARRGPAGRARRPGRGNQGRADRADRRARGWSARSRRPAACRSRRWTGWS